MHSVRTFSTRPLYLQVRDALVERIIEGQWKPGAPIPNEIELAKEMNVSQGTLRRALCEMEDERLVSRRQGRGTYVNDQSSEQISIRFSNIRSPDGRRLSGTIKTLATDAGPATSEEQTMLRIRTPETVVRSRRVRVRGNRPFLYERVAWPERLFPGLANSVTRPERVSALGQMYGVLIGHAEERVLRGMPDAAAADALGIDPEFPVMKLERVIFTSSGVCAEARVAYCNFADEYYLTEIK
jgi:GntR family transcriptional regulator